MQQAVPPIPRDPYTRSCLFPVAASALLLLAVGCEPGTPPDAQPPKPLHGTALTLSCPDAATADALAPMVRAWETRTGATVAIRREAMTDADDSDVGVIGAGELGKWAEAGGLAAVPEKLRTDPAFQWSGFLPAYGERLVEWGGQTLAVPLTGDGHVLVYRADRFRENRATEAFAKRHPYPLAAPSTWEDFADVAAVFAELDKRPSLPPLPADAGGLFDLLSRVAASADRASLNDFQLAAQADKSRDTFGFQFAVATGRPRLLSSGYLPAARWLERLRASNALPAPGGPDDPVAALADGRAVMAVLSLDQLVKLPRKDGGVPSHFALAGVPGTRQVANAPPLPREAPPNYVPYFGGGRLGVVRSRCPHEDAAFDLLADLGSPARAAELIATPGLGAGPTRVAHVDRERLLLWYGYGFDEERSKALQDALRQYTEPAVKNPTFGLRGPDRAALLSAADAPLRAIGTGGVSAQDRVKQVEDAWNALDAKVPADVLMRWRTRGAGLN